MKVPWNSRFGDSRTRGRAWLFRLAWGVFLSMLAGCTFAVQPAAESPAARDPLVPTPVATPAPAQLPPASDTATDGADATAADEGLSAVPTATPVESSAPPPLPEPYSLRWRVGAAVPDGRSPAPLPWPQARPGWYLNWSVGYTDTVWAGSVQTETLSQADFAIPPDTDVGMGFVPLVWVNQGEVSLPQTWLSATAAHLPGRTWLIGNEPDVRWQSNSTPSEYARAYHKAYTTIKAADPSARVAFGGLSQITPLRLQYLDAVWAAYAEMYGAEMPVDVWTMHAFVLQEKAGAWGVDIPPGLEAETGTLWTIEQHDDLALVEEQIRRMRRWMAAHGQQQKPLWITEYGILMPAAYGFDLERVRAFMLGSFDLFRALRDPALGLAADGDRLVQRWMWFSTDDVLYPTGNLFTLGGEPTGLLSAMQAYLAEFGEP